MPLHASSATQASTPASWLHAAHGVELEEMAGAQADWRLQYDQLSKGRFSGSVQQVHLPGMRLVVERASHAVRQRGQIGSQDMGFALGLSPKGSSYFHGQLLDGNSLMMGRGDELDLTSPDDFMLIGVVVSGELLAQLWQRLYQKPWAQWLDQKVVVQARAGMAAHVRQVHLGVMDRLAAEPGLLTLPKAMLQLRDTLLIDWLEAIPEQVDTSDLRSVQARRRMVERACELVLSQRDQAPSMLQVCNALGTSPRKLEYCFRDVLGISPSKYLRAVRLNGARRELMRCASEGDGGSQPPTVHDIAACWGFWHMGAFSADYKQQFGELPSTTQLKARGSKLRRGMQAPSLPSVALHSSA